MFSNLGFSYTGLIFLACLFVPNFLYVLYPPKDLKKTQESRVLQLFERAGQVLFTILVLIFESTNFHQVNLWSIWLAISILLTILYLISWLRYFLGSHNSRDFYRPFLSIPIPLAILPVTAAFCLAVYGKSLILGIAVVILAIGHIGITAKNNKLLNNFY